MLSFITDEQISRTTPEQMTKQRPEITIESLRDWRGGAFVGVGGEALLAAAHAAGLTLVTTDRRTISPLLVNFGVLDRHHAGVILVDLAVFPPDNAEGLARALMAVWDAAKDADWTDRIDFLQPVPAGRRAAPRTRKRPATAAHGAEPTRGAKPA